MTTISVLSGATAPDEPRTRRRRFGLDSPLPADPAVIERAILRHLAERRPSVVALTVRGLRSRPAPTPRPESIELAAGVPELFLLLPRGRLACLKIKTQAQTLTHPQRAFADLCREQGIPFHVVRSLPEAIRVLDALLDPATEGTHG